MSDGPGLPVAVRYAAVLSASSDAVLITDPTGRIVDLNPAAEAMFGSPRPQLLGRLPIDPADPAGGHRRLRAALELVGCRQRWSAEAPFTRPDGSAGRAQVTVSGIWDDAGALLGTVGVSRDVTAARGQGAALAEAEQRWRLTLDYAPIGIALVGLDGRWLWVNEALCRIVGYREGELLGRTFADSTHPDDLGADESMVEQLVSGAVSHYQMEKRYIHARGHLVPVSLSAALARDEAGAPLHLVCQVEDVTERRARTDRLEALASRDTLTGLTNRVRFLAQLDSAAVGGPHRQPFAVGFADLDEFKTVNDSYGHGAGDQLLRVAAQRITAALRPGDVAARLGGDEFALLLRSVAGPRDVHAIARRLLAALAAPFHLDDATVSISASLGVAIGEPGCTGPALLSRADAAMYRVKAGGKNTYTIG